MSADANTIPRCFTASGIFFAIPQTSLQIISDLFGVSGNVGLERTTNVKYIEKR
jgi:hypothetical protein